MVTMRLARGHYQALWEFSTLIYKQRQLTWEMLKRELSERHAGQALGVLWAIFHPLFLMGLYVFVFAFVFKTRIGGTFDLPRDYTTYILANLIPWLSCQDAMNRSASAITGNAALVKQVVFPVEILPLKGVLVSMLSQLIATVVLAAYSVLSGSSIPWTYVLLLPLWGMQIVAMTGLGLVLSAMGAYFRDTKEIVQLFGLAGVYLVPAFYLPDWVPGIFKPLLYANPFSYLIWCYQDALYFGRIEHPWAWGILAGGSIVSFVIGYRLFRRVKISFGNVL